MKILVVQTGFLGDILLSSPVWSNLRQLHPDAHISVLTTKEGHGLIASHPAVNEVIVFDKRAAHKGLRGLLQMKSELAAKKFDLVFSLHKSIRTASLLFLSRIPLRYGFKEAAWPWLYTKTVRRKHLSHEALRNLVILTAAGFPLSKLDSRLSLGISERAKLKAAEILDVHDRRPVVGIAPGSVWATKRWTVNGFAAVAEELSEMGYRVLLLGGPKDEASAQAVEKLSGAALLNLVGKTDLETSAALIARLSLLVTNDSSPLHIASALSTPVVATFCATVPEFGFGPWQVLSEVVGVPGLSCRPCGRHGGEDCPTGTHACQLKLRSEVVMDAVQRVLEKSRIEVGSTDASRSGVA